MNDNDEEKVSASFSLLSLGMGLNRSQQQLIIRTLWVLIVTTHILWACGMLGIFGLASPFARADEVAELKRSTTVIEKIQLTQEMRVQTIYWCKAKDEGERTAFEQALDRLRDEYKRITGGETPPEFKCP